MGGFENQNIQPEKNFISFFSWNQNIAIKKKFVKLPDANIGGNHVHKANPGHEFVFVDVHFMIEKNKVHLNKYKNHL